MLDVHVPDHKLGGVRDFVIRPEALSADDIKSALPDVRRAITHLGGMMDITRGTLQAYDEALK